MTDARSIEEVRARAVAALGGEEAAERWLETPVRGLNFAKPITLLPTEQGREAVWDILCRMEHGVF